MVSKRLTIIVLACALCYLEPDFTGWIVSTPLAPPKQWASTPGISPNPFSALTQFALQLTVKQEQDAHKRVKETSVRPTDAEPCSKEHTLLKGGPFMVVEDLLLERGHRENILHFTGKRDEVLKRSRVSQTKANTQSPEVKRAGGVSLRGTAVREAVHRVETETRRPGAIVWVISFHRVCLLVTMGLLARITIRILLQDTNAPECKSEGQKGSNLPGTCPITVIQNGEGPHTATARRKRRGVRSCKDC
ncbi:hypothetical protein AALO_G00264690 [Alosa alosa]|uniref:Uncharacterized protein n=1 Tax=Alosa alosa TaxID=278164 RepID=A0AAV6FLR5_9TELE|nr:uncharacterized protein LOC125286747 [Alosa alosa]KAG5263424.1 hypothetical protein AALO_G00264690 [Alosa alosa]